MPHTHRRLSAPCEGDDNIDAPGPLLPVTSNRMPQCSLTDPAVRAGRSTCCLAISPMWTKWTPRITSACRRPGICP